MLRLWCHECSRVFEDRLVNTEDKEWFQELLRKHVSSDFQVDSTAVLGSGPLFYGDFMLANTDNKLYEEITNIDKVCDAYQIISPALAIPTCIACMQYTLMDWTPRIRFISGKQGLKIYIVPSVQIWCMAMTWCSCLNCIHGLLVRMERTLNINCQTMDL